MPEAAILGSWKLVSFEVELRDSTERQRPFGMNPNGYLVLGHDGRMMALLTAGERMPGQKDSEVAALFRTMMSYTGRYRLDGSQFITKVDASWNESWNGGEQVRFWEIKGDRPCYSQPMGSKRYGPWCTHGSGHCHMEACMITHCKLTARC